MHGLVGWIGADANEGLSARDSLDTMLQAQPSGVQGFEFSRVRNAAAAAEHRGASIAKEDGLLVVVNGRPRFTGAEAGDENPARTALKFWRIHGRDLPQRISGTFALAVLDTHRNTAFLAVDRIGVHSLAFSSTARGLAFSNRADCVAGHPNVGFSINPQGLFNYFYFYDVPAPGTIFTGVEKLLPGEWAFWGAGRVERGFYWRLRYRDAPRRDFAEQATRLKKILRNSVARARGADEAAAFLSGGTDSSTVAGVLAELQSNPTRTYSIGFEAQGFDEMEYARLAAKHFGLDAREYYVTPEDILTAIPVIAGYYDEPFANESAVSAHCCARLAAQDGYKVILAGDGGDEIFGGNARYAQQRLFEGYQSIPAFLRRTLIEPVADLPWMVVGSFGRRLHGYVRKAKTPLPERMEAYNFIYRQPLEEMFTKDFLGQVDPHLPAGWLKTIYDGADSRHYINRMLHLDMKFTLADNDLRKVCGMAEAAGIEVRFPLLDDELVEFSGELPPDWKVRGYYLRWFFKSALKGYLPDAILTKKKHGFGLPFGLWAIEHPRLRERVEDRVSDFRNRGWLQPAYLDRLREDHAQSHATYFGKMLWVILILEEWLEKRGAPSRRVGS